MVSDQGCECVLGEHVSDQTDVFVQSGLSSIGHRNSGGFLSAMLECKKSEKGELSDVTCG
jgi:hypothetical protein